MDLKKRWLQTFGHSDQNDTHLQKLLKNMQLNKFIHLNA